MKGRGLLASQVVSTARKPSRINSKESEISAHWPDGDGNWMSIFRTGCVFYERKRQTPRSHIGKTSFIKGYFFKSWKTQRNVYITLYPYGRWENMHDNRFIKTHICFKYCAMSSLLVVPADPANTVFNLAHGVWAVLQEHHRRTEPALHQAISSVYLHFQKALPA